MSAILVLILRILLVIGIYGFLGFTILFLWRELKQTNKKEVESTFPGILIILNDDIKLSFNQPEIWIGRGAENDIHIPDETASLKHARLYFENGNWLLEDSRSTNGTFLNDEAVRTATVLVNNDRINVGSHSLTIAMQK